VVKRSYSAKQRVVFETIAKDQETSIVLGQKDGFFFYFALSVFIQVEGDATWR
jgi:hypothetical protein